jgi:hypothetical protein
MKRTMLTGVALLAACAAGCSTGQKCADRTGDKACCAQAGGESCGQCGTDAAMCADCKDGQMCDACKAKHE